MMESRLITSYIYLDKCSLENIFIATLTLDVFFPVYLSVKNHPSSGIRRRTMMKRKMMIIVDGGKGHASLILRGYLDGIQSTLALFLCV